MTERGLKNINVFYSTFTNVFFIFVTFFTFFNVFYFFWNVFTSMLSRTNTNRTPNVNNRTFHLFPHISHIYETRVRLTNSSREGLKLCDLHRRGC